ncbi:MAG TPA: hypothetical protein VD866_07120 [Urbifossiella sp.]|nr:hypothetical protein [Urbifossiella sp.]
MPRPKFVVRHFIACLAAPWEGTPGPDTFRTLESVGYFHQIPPDTEFPAELRFWLYTRFFWTGGGDGDRTFAIEVHWLDAPSGQPWSARFLTGRVRITAGRAVTSTAWPIGPILFPGEGRYEFRLLCRTRRPWGDEDREVASEFIRIERAS